MVHIQRMKQSMYLLYIMRESGREGRDMVNRERKREEKEGRRGGRWNGLGGGGWWGGGVYKGSGKERD